VGNDSGPRDYELREDLIRPWSAFVPEETGDAVADILRSKWINTGKQERALRTAFQDMFNAPHCVACMSGTAALRTSYAAIGVGPGDEVITTPYTFIATNTAILEQGGTPVFADIQYGTLNIDPESVAERITPRTKAIVCVHYGGYPCDLEELRAIAAERGVPLVEDAAHAMGSMYRGEYIGATGDFVTFSLQVVKIVTAGDGGLICTSSPEKHAMLKRLVWYGIDRESKGADLIDPLPDTIDLLGFKYNMNDITATIGLVGLSHFERAVARRREIGRRYRRELDGLQKVSLLRGEADRMPNHQIFPVHVHDRERFATFMRSRGIVVSINNRRNDRYAIFGDGVRDLPNTARAEQDTILVPLHGDLTNDDVDRIIATIIDYDRE
jgi:dTDP-4-amino-4,6-dideoxygalactose transaminase